MKIKSFGGYTFSYYLGEDSRPLASLPGARTILAAAGYWDDLGDVSVLRPGVVGVKFALYHDTSWTALDALVDTAKQNLFDGRQLLKLAPGDGSGSATRQALARCIGFDEVWKYEQPRLLICTARFELLQECWDSTFEAGSYKVTTPFTISTVDSTCQIQRTLRIWLSGPINTIWTLTNTTNGMALQVDGASAPIESGRALLFNCGSLTATVTYLGVVTDYWPYVSIGAYQMGFMALEPGDNVFTASMAAGVNMLWREAYL